MKTYEAFLHVCERGKTREVVVVLTYCPMLGEAIRLPDSDQFGCVFAVRRAKQTATTHTVPKSE